jgi:RES domain-containing protein
MPAQIMIEYEVPDHLPKTEVGLSRLPRDWIRRQAYTQRLGDEWLDSQSDVLLVVPSALVPITAAPDRNVLINHRHAGAASIEILSLVPFTLDPRLFAP